MNKNKSSVPSGALKMSKGAVEARMGLRRSGAAGLHDSRPNRARTRAASKSRAIHESKDF
jgi:hypothetical protein